MVKSKTISCKIYPLFFVVKQCAYFVLSILTLSGACLGWKAPWNLTSGTYFGIPGQVLSRIAPYTVLPSNKW